MMSARIQGIKKQGDVKPRQARFAIEQQGDHKRKAEGQDDVTDQEDHGVAGALAERRRPQQPLEVLQPDKHPACRLALLYAQDDRIENRIDLDCEQDKNGRQIQTKAEANRSGAAALASLN